MNKHNFSSYEVTRVPFAYSIFVIFLTVALILEFPLILTVIVGNFLLSAVGFSIYYNTKIKGV